MSAPKLRDPLRDYLKAVDDQIADRAAAGVGPTPYLLEQKAELEAALGIAKPEPKTEPKPEVAPEPELEHKAELPLEETAVPRRPGRPRKNPDVDSAAGS